MYSFRKDFLWILIWAFIILIPRGNLMSNVMHVDVIPSTQRGQTKTSWLDSKHSFSFGNYTNLKRLNFGTLRVLNEDMIKPGKGFGTHHHENMEIITILLSGSLEHKDNRGNHGILQPGDIQRMSAGTGIEHSEYNASQEEVVHLLQIWIFPKERDIDPSYEQKHFPSEMLQGCLCPIISKVPSNDRLFIHQDSTFFLGEFAQNQTVLHSPQHKRQGEYLFVIQGKVGLGDLILQEGDAAQITHADVIEIHAIDSSKVLLIEVDVNTL